MTYDWTQVSRTIGEHSTHKAKDQVIKSPNKGWNAVKQTKHIIICKKLELDSIYMKPYISI